MGTSIIESRIRSQSAQQDGTVLVVEEHELSDGRIITTPPYYAQSEADIQLTLQARAVKIQTELDVKARIEAEANNYEIPLAKSEFRDRYTPEEQGVVEYQYATYLTNELYTAEQKATIAAGRAYFNDVRGVVLTNPLTIAGVQMHEELGWIAAGRANEILGIE